jgi:putative transposase
VEIAFIASFDGRLRDECLNAQWIGSVAEARATLGARRIDFDDVRPHSSLGGLPRATPVAGGRLPAETVLR